MIGGGSTGAGVARDAAMRGLRTVLVERKDPADGTTGRFHGLLHSGAATRSKTRTRPGSASRRTPSCDEPPPTASRTPAVCSSARRGTILRSATSSSRAVERRAFRSRRFGRRRHCAENHACTHEPRGPSRFPMPPSTPWKLVWGCARSAEEHGARILPYHRVLGLERDGSKVTGALVRNELTGEELRIHADVVINAAGAWAGQIAELAGCRVNVLPGKGIMIAMNHRLVNTVVNRCKMPADGDIIVPIRTVCDRRDDRHAGRRSRRARGHAGRDRRML